ncbi:MAG: hypothetical protein JSV03_03795 [Planctomycetota bacterium]|nr:MAG: hypothetical protein JSV03_03795 [Planctomycetota bacterium]
MAEKMTLFNQPQPVQMPKLRWLNTIGLSIILLCLPTAVGCGSTTGWSAQQPNISRPHRTPKNPAKNNQTPKPPEHVPSNPQGPNDSKPAVTAQEILEHLPDPIEEIEQVNQKLANFPRELKKIDRELAEIERKLSRQQESPERDNDELELGVKQYQLQKEREDIITRQWAYPRLLNQLNTIRRNRNVRLGLNETISRALMNNYQIQMHAYSPAIAAASIVQA